MERPMLNTLTAHEFVISGDERAARYVITSITCLLQC